MNDREEANFGAVTGLSEGFGATPEQALAALMRSLPGDAPQPIVIWPYNQGDAFFSDAQQRRLQDLKSRRVSLTAEERTEMEDLIASAFDASVARAQSLPLVKS